jgi:signal transduction histidine kinase
MRASATGPSRGLPTIRAKLAMVVLAGLVPAALGMMLLVGHFYELERIRFERDTLQTARAMALAVDRDFAAARVAAVALATSSTLEGDDIAGFYRHAGSVLGSHFPATNFVLSDATGRQIANTLRPLGEALPRHGNPDQLRRVFETGQPLVSNVFIGGVQQRPVVSIDVPVRRGGKVVYCLSVGFTPDTIGRVFAEQRLPAERIAAVFDATGVIAARTHFPERFVGKKGIDAVIKPLQENREGMVEARTVEGVEALIAFTRSSETGWSVAIAIPKTAMWREVWQALSMATLLVVCLLAAGTSVAWVVGGRISRSIRALTGPAIALGTGEPVVIPQTHFSEAAEVAGALRTAANLLAQRTAERNMAMAAAEAEKAEAEEARLLAEQASKAKSGFLTNMSHELRTPLNAIIGFSDALLLKVFGPVDNPRHEDSIRNISKAGHHLLALINSLLDLAAVEAGKLRVRDETVPLGALIAESLDLVRPAAEGGGVAIECDFDPALPVIADPLRMKQVLLNLLSNAVKFTPAGGRVSVVARIAGGGLEIVIADTGIGMDEKGLAKALQPFEQIDSSLARKHAGTGLGLPLACRLVEMHGGRLDIRSQPGAGTTVTIRLGPERLAPRS